MDLKLLLISSLLGVFCYSNAQKGKISLSDLIGLYALLLYSSFIIHHYSVKWCNFVDVSLQSKHTSHNDDYPPRKRGQLLYLNDVIDQRSTLASRSIEDNGKDRIFGLCLQLPSSHIVFQMNWCVNTGGLTSCLLCRDCAAPLLPLTLPPLLSLFSIQRGMSASMPTPNTAGNASRLEPNVAGVKTQYVNRSCQL